MDNLNVNIILIYIDFNILIVSLEQFLFSKKNLSQVAFYVIKIKAIHLIFVNDKVTVGYFLKYQLTSLPLK